MRYLNYLLSGLSFRDSLIAPTIGVSRFLFLLEDRRQRPSTMAIGGIMFYLFHFLSMALSSPHNASNHRWLSEAMRRKSGYADSWIVKQRTRIDSITQRVQYTAEFATCPTPFYCLANRHEPFFLTALFCENDLSPHVSSRSPILPSEYLVFKEHR